MYRVLSNHVRRRILPNSILGTTIPKWMIGIALVTTPTVAAIQGAYLLHEFRNNHLNAPIPVSPSRGIVIMKSTTTTISKSNIDNTNNNNTRPLRLLVIGDSLAAGVGVLKQSTPILPESIAKALSEASGGRAVSWTCVGNPGATSSQIVKDIVSYDDDDNNNNNFKEALERILMEWKTKTQQKAQEWFNKTRRKKSDNDDVVANKRIDVIIQKIKRRWSRVRKEIQSFRPPKVIDKRTKAEENMSSPATELIWNDNNEHKNNNEYDIAVVLTGLNDLKEIWLPWMMMNTPTNSNNNNNNTDGIKGELLRVLHALQRKMMKLDVSINNDDNNNKNTITTSEKQQNNDSIAVVLKTTDETSSSDGPLVVFPALPISTPTHPFMYKQPLSWFVIPLLRKIDHHKKLLAERFPNAVLYVESPSASSMEDMEAGRGSIYNKRKAEEVLLRWTDVTKKARDKVERLMKQHLEQWSNNKNNTIKNTNDDETTTTAAITTRHHHQQQHKEEEDYNNNEDKTTTGFVSVDNVHPNDEGYDFWGRHIAAAIVTEWEERKKKESI